jgi:hypothetical protein
MSVCIWFSIIMKKISLGIVQCLDKSIRHFRGWLLLDLQLFLYQWLSAYERWRRMTIHNSGCLLATWKLQMTNTKPVSGIHCQETIYPNRKMC